VKPPPAASFVLLTLVGLFWLGMMSYATSFRTAGEFISGIQAIVAVLCAFALWLTLGGLLILTAVSRRFTLWTGLAAPVVFVLSALGANHAAGLDDYHVSCALSVVAVLPLLVALYAFRPSLLLAAAIVLISVPLMVQKSTGPEETGAPIPHGRLS
jgi:hypothetical protein